MVNALSLPFGISSHRTKVQTLCVFSWHTGSTLLPLNVGMKHQGCLVKLPGNAWFKTRHKLQSTGSMSCIWPSAQSKPPPCWFFMALKSMLLVWELCIAGTLHPCASYFSHYCPTYFVFTSFLSTIQTWAEPVYWKRHCIDLKWHFMMRLSLVTGWENKSNTTSHRNQNGCKVAVKNEMEDNGNLQFLTAAIMPNQIAGSLNMQFKPVIKMSNLSMPTCNIILEKRIQKRINEAKLATARLSSRWPWLTWQPNLCGVVGIETD